MNCDTARELIGHLGTGAGRTKMADRDLREHRAICADCDAAFIAAFDATSITVTQPPPGSDIAVTIQFAGEQGDRLVLLFPVDPDRTLEQIIGTGGIAAPSGTGRSGFKRRQAGRGAPKLSLNPPRRGVEG